MSFNVWFNVITLFPDMFDALQYGITGRALSSGLMTVNTWNPRDFTDNKYRNVDDRPYGGGPGMVMTAQPLQSAVNAAKKAAAPWVPKVIYLTPQGKRLTQDNASYLLQHKSIILLLGRYEGIDERIIDLAVDEEWSIGDYILSGGELAAMVMIDMLARLLPGALGHEESAKEESLSAGLLEYPQYTRPEQFQGISVPKVLMSGDHQAIARWRLKQSLGRTWLKRPDLLANRALTETEKNLLMEFKEEYQHE